MVRVKGQILNGSLRKAYASKGDDATLSRFVKVPGDFRKKSHPKPVQGWLSGTRFPASIEGRTIFKKSVKDVAENPMVSGHSNVKIGRDVRKGKLFRGYWIYTLTLEERATCPRSCFHWDTCYGNNMPFAKQIDHSDPVALYGVIRRQIERELSKRNRAGLLVRLHALGDFYDTNYVTFWNIMLQAYPRLAVFGYTAWPSDSEIGLAILHVKKRYGRRFSIRWSNGKMKTDCTVPIAHEKDCPPNAFICPEQTGRTAACATCGLCWNTDKNVAFLEH